MTRFGTERKFLRFTNAVSDMNVKNNIELRSAFAS